MSSTEIEPHEGEPTHTINTSLPFNGPAIIVNDSLILLAVKYERLKNPKRFRKVLRFVHSSDIPVIVEYQDGEEFTFKKRIHERFSQRQQRIDSVKEIRFGEYRLEIAHNGSEAVGIRLSSRLPLYLESLPRDSNFIQVLEERAGNIQESPIL